MSTILEHPQAQELLAQTEVEPETVCHCRRRLTRFVQRYLPCFYRDEHRQHAQIILQGKLTGLQRKTTEPIAMEADLKRRPLQHFVGAGGWQDDAVLAELRRHVGEELGEADGVLVLDPSAFPKKGIESCGVARQWCGRLGKVDNCQVGVFLAYVASRGQTLVDGRLFLPHDRAADRKHRVKTYVPKEITFAEKWRLGLDLVRTSGQELAHGWIVGDDEFGRVTEFRAALRQDKERYVLDVPCDTLMRDLSERRPPSRPGGKPRWPLWERVDHWAAPAQETLEEDPLARRRAGATRRVGHPTTCTGQRRRRPRGSQRAVGGHQGVWAGAGSVVHAEQRVVGDTLSAGGRGSWSPPWCGRVVRGRQPGSGAEPLRGTELDGLAPSHDPVAAGVVVFANGAVGGWGKKIRGSPRRWCG